jgi:hypothetical protein
MKYVEQMSNYELSRWMSLYIAVNTVAEKCTQKNINFRHVDLEPLSIKDYVDNSYFHHEHRLNMGRG